MHTSRAVCYIKLVLLAADTTKLRAVTFVCGDKFEAAKEKERLKYISN